MSDDETDEAAGRRTRDGVRAAGGAVHDPGSDRYIDPTTGQEDPHAARLRRIEESGRHMFNDR